MSASMEALAMAGADYQQWGLDIEEWERRDAEMDVPPHLLADESEDEEHKRNNGVRKDDDRDRGGRVIKARAAAAADCDVKMLVGRAIESSISHVAVLLKQLKL